MASQRSSHGSDGFKEWVQFEVNQKNPRFELLVRIEALRAIVSSVAPGLACSFQVCRHSGAIRQAVMIRARHHADDMAKGVKPRHFRTDIMGRWKFQYGCPVIRTSRP
jgi:hypothetical protein